MTETSPRAESERRAAPELLSSAAVVAAGVFAISLVQTVLGALASFAAYSDPSQVAAPFLLSTGGQILVSRLPFAVGILLTLWLVRPVTAGSSVLRVIGTGAIAALGGGILVFVVQLVQLVVQAPDYHLMGRLPGVNAFYSIGSSVNLVISAVPLVVLATVLLWLYLRRRTNELV